MELINHQERTGTVRTEEFEKSRKEDSLLVIIYATIKIKSTIFWAPISTLPSDGWRSYRGSRAVASLDREEWWVLPEGCCSRWWLYPLLRIFRSDKIRFGSEN